MTPRGFLGQIPNSVGVVVQHIALAGVGKSQILWGSRSNSQNEKRKKEGTKEEYSQTCGRATS